MLFMEVQFKNRKNDVVSSRIIHTKLPFDSVDYTIIVFSVFLLIFLFINPSLLYIICQYCALYIL
jgi:hypothetical protein